MATLFGKKYYCARWFKGYKQRFETLLELQKMRPFFLLFRHRYRNQSTIYTSWGNTQPLQWRPNLRFEDIVSHCGEISETQGCRIAGIVDFTPANQMYVSSKATRRLSIRSAIDWRLRSRFFTDSRRISRFLASIVGRGELHFMQWDTHDQLFQTKRPYLWRKSKKLFLAQHIYSYQQTVVEKKFRSRLTLPLIVSLDCIHTFFDL